VGQARVGSARADLTYERGRGAGAEHLRRFNLSTILTLLHHDGSQPRSMLTTRTGLNRSTVAALVAELVERGLVFESPADPTKQVGRPSPTVNVDPRTVAIAVNPEIDAVTVGVVGLGGTVATRIRCATDRPPSAREAANITAAVLEGLRGPLERDGRILGIGVAVPGLVHAGDGLVRFAPHLEWRDEPFAAILSDATGLPAHVGNDANLGAIAEHIHGAGRGIAEMIYLNGGPSGIGGGIIAGGGLAGGAEGYAGEFGHSPVAEPGGATGTLEEFVNRAALLAALGMPVASPDELEAALLESDDPAVDALVRLQLDRLGDALGTSVNILNPQRIVLGGFLGSLLMKEPEYLEARISRSALSAPRESVEVVRAELGSDLLMIGAAELAFAGILQDPGMSVPAQATAAG
jgi:predicted NBD/HSP70 family sugar kinase